MERKLQLLIDLIKTDFKLNYQLSFLGYLWMVLNPLIMLITLYIVFSRIIVLNIDNYQIFLLIGIAVWNYFLESSFRGMTSLSQKANMIKKVKIPIYIIVLSSSVTPLVNFIITFIMIISLMLYFKVTLSLLQLISLFYIVLLFLSVMGISFMLSTAYVYIKDISHIWNNLTLIGFWVTPIFYSLQNIPFSYRRFFQLNPIARIIIHLRELLLGRYINFEQTIITVVICLIIFLTGLYVFERFSDEFPERV